PAEYGKASPIASETVAMVLAVNCAPQAPADGQACCSSVSRSAFDISPTECLPTASNTSWMVTGWPLKVPGKIEPPQIHIYATLSPHIALIMPGSDLSQPARPTSAS